MAHTQRFSRQKDQSSDDEPDSIHRMKQIKLKQQMTLGNTEFVRYVKSHPGLDAMFLDLERLWRSQQTPSFYTNAFIHIIKTLDLQPMLEKIKLELQLGRQGKSTYHRIMEAINTRYICIQSIRNQLVKAQIQEAIHNANILKLFRKKYTHDPKLQEISGRVAEQGFKSLSVKISTDDALAMLRRVFQDINRLRQLTVYVVELIHQWRDSVMQALQMTDEKQHVNFLINDEIFYDMIRQDTNFIWSSDLCGYILMQYDCDIFLVRNILNLQSLAQKQLLEQYFLQIMYPKDDKIFDRTVEAMSYLTYVWKPKEQNKYQIEQLLVQNYIRMDYSPGKIEKQQIIQKEIQKKVLFKEDARNAVKNQKRIRKSMVSLRLKHQKIDLQRKVSIKLDLINKKIEDRPMRYPVKPFNIVNFAMKDSLGLQKQATELSEHQKTEQDNKQEKQQPNKKQQKQPDMKEQASKSLKIKKLMDDMKRVSLIPVRRITKHKQHIHNRSAQHYLRNPYKSKVKINTFKKNKNNSQGNIPQMMATAPVKEIIEVDEGYMPFNKRIFDVFGTVPVRIKKTSKPQVVQDDTRKKVNTFSENVRQKNGFLSLRKKQFKLQMAEKPQKLYNQYRSVDSSPKNIKKQPSPTKISSNPISLKPKSIPLNMLHQYIQHLFSCRNPLLSLFTDYNQDKVTKRLQEAQKVFIVEMMNNEDSLGQVILTQNISKIGLIKYDVQYSHVNKFENFIPAILHVSDKVFNSTPAHQFSITLKLDKMDDVSKQFVRLIDEGFAEKATVLQKSLESYLGHDVYERLYVVKRPMQIEMPLESADNRLLVRANAFIFCSNFKLRKMSYMTRHYRRTTRQNRISISLLYAHVLDKIMTKHHMRVIKNGPDYLKQVLVLLYKIKTIQNYDCILDSQFSSTADLKNYLEYRDYDAEQRLLQFMEDSKFIMKKQLILSQFIMETRLDFKAYQTVCRVDHINCCYLVLQNYRNLPFQIITSSEYCSEAVLFPCSQGHQMLLMQAEEYLGLDMDLYSYLLSFFQKQRHRVTQVVEYLTIPEVCLKLKVTESDSLAEQFPQRQFYYSGSLEFTTERNMQLGIIRQPMGMVFKAPLIVGFCGKGLEVCYLVHGKNILKDIR